MQTSPVITAVAARIVEQLPQLLALVNSVIAG